MKGGFHIGETWAILFGGVVIILGTVGLACGLLWAVTNIAYALGVR